MEFGDNHIVLLPHAEVTSTYLLLIYVLVYLGHPTTAIRQSRHCDKCVCNISAFELPLVLNRCYVLGSKLSTIYTGLLLAMFYRCCTSLV